MLVIGTLLGFYWGLIRQLLSLLGLIVGVLAARRFGPEIGDWLTSFVVSDALAKALGFVTVLIAVSAASSLVASVLRLFVGLLFLGWLDHLLGAILGLIQVVVACVVLIAAATTIGDTPLGQAVQQSRVAAELTRNFGGVLQLLDEPMQRAARAAFSQR